MKKNYIIIVVSCIMVLITTILFLTTNINKKYDLILSNEFSSKYIDKLNDNYKLKSVDIGDYSMYFNKAKAIEMDEYSAKTLLDSGLGIKFVPSFNIKTVLVKNNDKTTTDYNSLNDLLDNDVSVNFTMTSKMYTISSLMTISYNLENKFDLDTSINYLNKIYKEKRLSHKKIDIENNDYLITSNFYANTLKENGLNISIIDIAEGSLNTNIGLLIIDENVDLTKYYEALNEANLKVEEYSNTYECSDYEVFGKFQLDRVRKFRRNVLGTYKFSGVNSDERSIILIIYSNTYI